MADVRIPKPVQIRVAPVKNVETLQSAAIGRLQPAMTKSATSYLSSAARKRGFALNVSSMRKK